MMCHTWPLDSKAGDLLLVNPGQKGQGSERRRVSIDYVCYHTNGTALITDNEGGWMAGCQDLPKGLAREPQVKSQPQLYLTSTPM